MKRELQEYIFKQPRADFQQLLFVLYDVIMGLNPSIEASIKWQMLAFDYNGPFLGLGAFKHKTSLFFFRGAEIEDPDNLFDKQTGKALRTLHLVSIDEINELFEAYLLRALSVNE